MVSGSKESRGNVRPNGSSGLRYFVSTVVYVVLLNGSLTPTMATLSIVFLKLLGWFSARVDIIAIELIIWLY